MDIGLTFTLLGWILLRVCTQWIPAANAGHNLKWQKPTLFPQVMAAL